MSKRTVIVSGGLLEEDFVVDILKDEETEFIIGVDSGLSFLYEHGILPDYIVGDFDSAPEEIITYYKEETKVPVREFNPIKDASDTEIALRLCLDLRRQNILILGGTGTRLDHAWANVQTLKIALDAGADARIVDRHNQIRLLDRDFVLKKEEAFGPYFSVFPLDGTVENFCLKGAKYPLNHHALTPFDSLCVSNEIAGDEVEITFPFGVVVLMETRD
ncbi:thiamine diphosphokinase [Clostridium sp. AF19-22AC]|jgi:thiamine pyrophosphokinase|uniref:Thiamine diphosphokinase n=1 Tax=Faecalicatena orotica TaxID=1544 RepID=A0A2Y9BCL7_9FIRM|nr:MULTISPECIES: thiamine diphosphokinase [Clostridia]PWJ29935.1 thiamine diphosphokinase [Faecalicatena orotica]RHR30381.1 thiamine diphosphokinase [Clostridium sp. AF19-22AC]SSA55661.1 thiamine diphosphokinase [Faecalicatena orotica]